MNESTARDFDIPGLAHESTPKSVRLLTKEPDTHLEDVPSDEWSVHVSSEFNVQIDEWKALKLAVEHAGFNAEVSTNSLAVW